MSDHPFESNEFTTPLWDTDTLRRQSLTLELHHADFMSQWGQALSAMVPAQILIEPEPIQFKSYAQFLADVPAVSDIQVFEVEALQSLCAWCIDLRLLPTAVDCMFGGAGRIPVRNIQRPYTAIEMGVRTRFVESLATAYEAAWHAVFPIRLNSLRQESQLVSLRLCLPNDPVLHAKFKVSFNGIACSLNFCIPKRGADLLTQPAAHKASASAQPIHPAWDQSLQHRVYAAPVEAIAVLAKTEMTVAQLLSLSIGQVVPIELDEPVSLQVDGVTMMSGRYGVRNGRYALKVETLKDEDLEVPQTAGTPSGSQELSEAALAMSDFMHQVQQDEAAK
jgi:flagellar motor switch protein FliM